MKRLLPLLLILVSACSQEEKRPNILFIFSDDHASQALSAYDNSRIETPHLDQLAAGGILFTNCFCTNAICAPSRAVVLTGKYSHLNGITDNLQSFDGSQQTFPKLMNEAGYRTALIGKWHLKSEPTGFDYWEVLPGQGVYFDPEFIEMGVNKIKEGYVTDIIADDAVMWLKTYSYDQPFCLMIQHKAPHANWEWPEELKNEFEGDFAIPDNFNDSFEGRSAAGPHSMLKVSDTQWRLHYKYRFGDYPYQQDEEMYQRYMHDYLRCIRSVDNSIGRIMTGLKDAGFEDNTIVIYSSDQGFFLGEHGLYDKRFMYEEALRMPLLVKVPGGAKGQKVSEIVLNLDFSATILDLAGISIPPDIQGQSFAPLLRGEAIPAWRKSMYYHFYEKDYGIGEHEGIRTEDHKLIHFMYPEEGWELYDLTMDPKEMHNLVPDQRHKQLLEDLKTEMVELKIQYSFQ